MFESSEFRLFSIRGVDVRIDLSWLIILALVTWSFWLRFDRIYGHPTQAAIVMAVVGAILFFSSLLIHELAHALTAIRRGVEVESITLFLFGGATAMTSGVDRPRDAFAISAVGPYTSVVLAAGFGLIATGASALGIELVADVAGFLGWVNVALAVFNLLPGAPLDGGRVLRAAVWALTGREQASRRAATRAGQGIGILIAGFGVFLTFFVPQGGTGGLWLIFIGWYLARAASTERAVSEARDVLADRNIQSLVGSMPDPIPADGSLNEVMDDLVRRSDDAFPVRRDDRTVGVLVIDDIGGLGREERDVAVSEVMRPIDDVPKMPAERPAPEALQQLGRDDVIAITDDSGVVGLITTEQLRTAMQRLSRLGADGRDEARETQGAG